MTTHISMLRGINLGSNKKIGMLELKKLYESLQFHNVRTYINSGNVIFESDHNIPLITKIIQEKIKKQFSFEVSVLLRTKEELKTVISNNPYSKKDLSKVYVTFLSKIPGHFPVLDISKTKEKEDQFALTGREIYLYLPEGYGKTKLNNSFFEKKINVIATTRNWNTVTKLFKLASD